MKLSKFCPSCGDEAKILYGDNVKLCGNCYTNSNKLLDLPDKDSLTICENCDRLFEEGKLYGRFTDREICEKYFADHTNSSEKIEFEVSRNEDKLLIDYQVSKNDLEQSGSIELVLKEDICRECKGFEGAFTKSKIQLRGDSIDRISDHIMDRCQNLEEKNFDDFLVKKKDVEGGYNYLLSTEHMSQKVINSTKKKFEVRTSKSYKIIGKEDGKNIYRNTVLIRPEKG
ncbi:MAG: hypothetical protein BRC29_02325 [Nanohaloarchaea archaeon SW_7_43_1]|nr:MAG: hypothetical protein BRC29_02325 [Nanohaloarchaea archaeon SW_7_43_1]